MLANSGVFMLRTVPRARLLARQVSRVGLGMHRTYSPAAMDIAPPARQCPWSTTCWQVAPARHPINRLAVDVPSLARDCRTQPADVGFMAFSMQGGRGHKGFG
jgi:hypothetical protein